MGGRCDYKTGRGRSADRINAARQMIGRNVVVKVERVEQAALVTVGNTLGDP